MASKSIASIVLALMAGCNGAEPIKSQNLSSPPSTPISTERKVPVLEYVVKRGDRGIRLLQDEAASAQHFRVPQYGDGIAHWDDIIMEGDQGDVEYFFFVPLILSALNGDRSMVDGYYQSHEFPLSAGERLKVPDLNSDGEFNGSRGTQAGYSIFRGTRNPNGDLVEKSIEFEK